MTADALSCTSGSSGNCSEYCSKVYNSVGTNGSDYHLDGAWVLYHSIGDYPSSSTNTIEGETSSEVKCNNSAEICVNLANNRASCICAPNWTRTNCATRKKFVSHDFQKCSLMTVALARMEGPARIWTKISMTTHVLRILRLEV